MDTSNSLATRNTDYITGGHKVRSQEVTNEEWVTLIEAALWKVRPVLKYQVGFYECSSLDPSAPPHLQDERVQQAAEGIGLNLRRSRLRFMADSGMEYPKHGPVEGIYLTSLAQWIHGGYRQDDGVRSNWFCQVLTRDRMLTALDQTDQHAPQRRLGSELFTSLHRIVQDTVADREERLGRLRNVEATLATMRSRISE